jgi:hypothetical protein
MGDKTPLRALTEGEAAILGIVQQGYGPQNTADKVFFTGSDEAVLFVKSLDGTSPLMANLTNLATWRANGTISSDEELRKQWLRL